MLPRAGIEVGMFEQLQQLREEFLNPSSEFTPIPFWFWNDMLSETELERQILEFKEKGVDGFVIHPRLGLPEEIGYLTERYFHYVRFAVELAAKLDMKVVLYDEAMYPSGSCHGNVVRENPSFASIGLRMSEDGMLHEGETLAASAVHEGKLYYYIETYSGGTIRGVHYGEDDNEPNAPASADLLNPDAVACFIRLTHESYYSHLKDYFGSTVIGMFTDEPNILGRGSAPGLIPWTRGFLKEFQAEGGDEEDLYWLFAGDSVVTDTNIRAQDRYQKAIYSRMSAAYYKQISDWCREHGVGMTGHPEKSTDIGYLQYFDLPCQDIVWRFVAPEEEKSVIGGHSTMGKCSSDSARHRGKRRNGNECFGCCGALDDPYRFTREDMKWYLDWLFVRGVNTIFPHAFYYSLEGRRKEERPPEVGLYNGFWPEYKEISDYIKRMSALLTDSVNQTEIALLCGAEYLSWEMARPLFEHQIEFNYLEAELLPVCIIENGVVKISGQAYKVIVTDRMWDWKTELLLDEFQKQGGSLIRFEEDNFIKQVKTATNLDLTIEPPAHNLRRTHVKKSGWDILILTNEGEPDIKTRLYITKGLIIQIWDAQNGTILDLEQPVKDMELDLPKGESLVLVLQY